MKRWAVLLSVLGSFLKAPCVRFLFILNRFSTVSSRVNKTWVVSSPCYTTAVKRCEGNLFGVFSIIWSTFIQTTDHGRSIKAPSLAVDTLNKTNLYSNSLWRKKNLYQIRLISKSVKKFLTLPSLSRRWSNKYSWSKFNNFSNLELLSCVSFHVND